MEVSSAPGLVSRHRHRFASICWRQRIQSIGCRVAFDLFEIRPRKQREAQRNGCGIQRQQLVLKAKWFLTRSQHRLAAKSFRCFPKQLLKQCSRAMLIRIGQVGFAGRFRDSKVFQLTQTTTQAIANEPQRVGVGQMAKQHRHVLTDWLPDGLTLLLEAGRQVRLGRIGSDWLPQTLAGIPPNSGEAQASPDGKYLAHSSNTRSLRMASNSFFRRTRSPSERRLRSSRMSVRS